MSKDPDADKAAAVVKAEADFQADMQKAIEKRDAVYAKYPSDNLAAAAHDAVKGDDDLVFKSCPPDVQQRLEYQAKGVVDTGIANTDFEKKVAELSAKAAKA